MQIQHTTTAPTTSAPEPTFTGDVRIGSFTRHLEPSSLTTAHATFAPGARTPWKTNSRGQTLVITAGTGRAQQDGQDPVELHAGDIVSFPPHVRHWDGASPDQEMSAVVVYDGDVQFHDAVTEQVYRALG